MSTLPAGLGDRVDARLDTGGTLKLRRTGEGRSGEEEREGGEGEFRSHGLSFQNAGGSAAPGENRSGRCCGDGEDRRR